jgi:hypothetical protein
MIGSSIWIARFLHKNMQWQAKSGKQDKRFHIDFILHKTIVARYRRVKQ